MFINTKETEMTEWVVLAKVKDCYKTFQKKIFHPYEENADLFLYSHVLCLNIGY